MEKHKRDRDRDVLGKRKKVYWEKRKCALESESIKYFGTKFESYSVFYFGTEEVYSKKLFLSLL